ncbi:ribonuclease T2 family protein [Wenxinia saemankumensis]|uniref:Ribonuclease T2 n=1 Tax=Wenxinia saemankumensis TaxID=1447782 RepID=A0A1M6DRH0_9RHOB|nr:ribonuclease T2 [Wenxinia saemankumensis]SHI75801.1 ribonuclease T2 [Wenxinia saemankumensis]
MVRPLALLAALSALAVLSPLSARAEGRAGEFDYYVLSLSWSPSWCALEGDGRDSAQCDGGTGFGWILHGLWPQYEDGGWPQDCEAAEPPPGRAMAEAMADIMGTPGLARYQWAKHGSCSGLAPADYFGTARAAFERVARPELLRRLGREVTLPAGLVEEAFLAEDPGLEADGITITCRDGYIQEARICLTRDLELRTCGDGVRRDCALTDARLPPVR